MVVHGSRRAKSLAERPCAMASASDDSALNQLPSAYEQQVMSPNGADAQTRESLEASVAMPNGTGPRTTSQHRAGDEAYARALAAMAATSGMRDQTGPGATQASGERTEDQPRLNSATAVDVSNAVTEATDRPLLPHAALRNVSVPEERGI